LKEGEIGARFKKRAAVLLDISGMSDSNLERFFYRVIFFRLADSGRTS